MGGDKIGVMIFDSRDADRMDRASQPIYVQNEELCRTFEGEEVCFNNRLNAYMDHCWDGFYTCQKREQRFPTLVYQDADGYNIEYTGTPPKEQEFRLYGRTGSPGFLVTIQYPDAGAYSIYDENKRLVEPTEWDHSTQTWAEVTGPNCGQNRYEGVINRLQFWMTPSCRLSIIPRDAIMLGIRMEFTLDEFFAQGGVVTFADRMAAVLGVHAADIKVVSVYEGSTIVDFFVQQAENVEEALDLDQIAETFTEVVETMDEFMGSPVLNAVANGVPIATPHTPAGDGGVWNTFKNLWEEDEEELLEEPTEKQVSIEVRYRTSAAGGQASQ